VLVPHEISWVFRHLVLESQSNNVVLTSVGCISDGLQAMVLPKVRSSRARSALSFCLIDFQVAPSVIGRRQLAVLVLYRWADVWNRWPLTSCVEFYTCHYNAYFSTYCPLQWDVICILYVNVNISGDMYPPIFTGEADFSTSTLKMEAAYSSTSISIY
jgi:hypothetical protein